MNQNLTQKVIEAINQANELAVENSHQQLTPVHLAIVLLEDAEGLAQQAVLKHGNEETLRYVKNRTQPDLASKAGESKKTRDRQNWKQMTFVQQMSCVHLLAMKHVISARHKTLHTFTTTSLMKTHALQVHTETSEEEACSLASHKPSS